MAGVSNAQLLEALRALDGRLADLDKRIALTTAQLAALSEALRTGQERMAQHEHELRSLQAAVQELRISNRILAWFAGLTGSAVILYLGERALAALL
jgi:uncharacterized coiled-coil protein SlyX